MTRMTRMIRKTAAPSLILLLLCLAAPLGAATGRKLTSFTGVEVTEKSAKEDVIFVVAGDNRPTAKGAPMPRVAETILSEIGLIRPDFVLWTGDTVYGYCDTRDDLEAEYQRFAAAAKPLMGVVPFYNAPGNHEIHSDQTASDCAQPVEKLCWADPAVPGNRCSEEVFVSHFGQLYGAVDYAGAHFIALDTAVPGDEDAISGPQLDWLTADLKSHGNARAIFLFTHTEFYQSPTIDPGGGRSHPTVARAGELQDLFARSPVAAVFSGHEHIFWHEPPEKHGFIDYFIAGGAGAPLYAPPDRGGFSHYVIVRVSGRKVSYDVIEPGRLYLEAVKNPPAGAEQFWIVNSNDAQPLPLRGLEVEIPAAALGGCDGLEPTGEFRRRDSWDPFKVAIDSCEAAAGGKLHLHLTAAPLQQGSVRVTVRRKPQP
jgi:hypothetical protein